MTAANESVSFDTATDANQYLTFHLGGEEYGLEILRVQEIKGYSTLTRMPNTPTYVKGVTNLRGAVVPIVDLRAKFGLEERPYDRFTVFIICTMGNKVVGLIVDAVSDVIDIPPDSIQATPDLAASSSGALIKGLARINERLVAMLDIDRVLAADVASVADAA